MYKFKKAQGFREISHLRLTAGEETGVTLGVTEGVTEGVPLGVGCVDVESLSSL